MHLASACDSIHTNCPGEFMSHGGSEQKAMRGKPMTSVRTAFTIALLLSVKASLFGQNVTSSILGTVVDPAGAVVGSAPVELTNQNTGNLSRAVTDSAGLFRIVNIQAGTYSGHVFRPRASRTSRSRTLSSMPAKRMTWAVFNSRSATSVNRSALPPRWLRFRRPAANGLRFWTAVSSSWSRSKAAT